tara:strand:- start:97 stop:648 length:552 start_codon:yes stop_codon:yes gene_type:complete
MDAPRTLSALPAELLGLVAEELDVRCLARFAAACAACLAAAQSELRAALLVAVKLCLEPGAGPFSKALVASPYFCLPDDLVILPESAFYYNTSVTELTLPATLTTIGNDALAECSSLTELNLPVALTSLGSSSFLGAASLRELTLPAAISTIGEGSFMSCSALAKITLPDALTSLAGATFKCN